ncbi:MAG: sugar phosphate isomerase/epimerase [Cellvibrionaceae bacterium]|nr:sugar phosphate isomerase/epimerase [Cellvibrionaceae bacterium]
MKLSVCTISFRHQLTSLEQIATWSHQHGFQGIELWGVHAKNLCDFPQYNPQWLNTKNLKVSMISDYLSLQGDEACAIKKMQDLCALAHFWQVKKIRTFAGDQASVSVNKQQRKKWVQRLQTLCTIAATQGVDLVVETHPNTLADTLESTLALLQEVNHSHLKINFDVIHLWEAGNDPQQAFSRLAPYIVHMHLKNISDHRLLHIFKPANVYAPAGNREAMVSLFEGAFDFQHFLRFVIQQQQLNWQLLDVSLEWFGEKVCYTLAKDKGAINALQGRYGVPFQQQKQGAMVI